MEHLYKLKKDGKTVGYLLLENGFLLASTNSRNYFYVQEQNPTGSLLIYPISNEPLFIDYDTAHPFVTKDKNGNDVFADDRVTFCLYRCREGEKGVIKWQQEKLRFVFVPDSDEFIDWGFTNKDIIELIEDKEDD